MRLAASGGAGGRKGWGKRILLIVQRSSRGRFGPGPKVWEERGRGMVRQGPEPNLRDYEEIVRNFSWEKARRELGLDSTEKINLAVAATDGQVAKGLGRKVAMYYDDGRGRRERYTFAELAALSSSFAAFLARLSLARGSRVCLFLPPVPEVYIGFLGTVKYGAVAMPVDPRFGPALVRQFLQDAQAEVILTTPELLARLGQGVEGLKAVVLVGASQSPGGGWHGMPVYPWAEVLATPARPEASALLDPEAPYLLMYTSGSTGRPKGVLHVHDGLVQYLLTGKWVLDLHPEDVYWCTAELTWITGVSYGVWAPWLNGCTAVVYGGEAEPAKWCEVIQRYRVTVLYGTPSEFRRLMAAGDGCFHHCDLGSLRHLLSVGEPLNPVLIRWAQGVFGCPIYDTYFMTETGAQMLANFRCLPVKPGSMGKPFPGIEARVLGEHGEALPPLEIGQLALRANWPSIMRQIWHDQELFAAYFRGPWYLTGDLVYQDRDGYFWFQGRTDDMIKIGGRRLGPFEIEDALTQHPAVLEAAAIGRPAGARGEVVKAFLVLAPGFSWSEALAREIREFATQLLPPYAVPVELEPCASLPRTRSGKLLRRVLRAKELGLPTEGTPV